MRRSLTFLELLIAVSITLAAGVGIYRTFCSGIELYRHLGLNQPAIHSTIFFNRLRLDLNNFCQFEKTNFEGSTTEIFFPVHAAEFKFLPPQAIEPGKKYQQESIYRVAYRFIPEEKILKRRIYKIGTNKPEKESVVLEDIESLRFIFHVRNESNNRIIRATTLSGKGPQAIEAEVSFLDKQARVHTLNRIIDIPVVE